MGLAFDPNTTSTKSVKASKAHVVQLFDIPESDKPSRRSQFPLTEEEEIYIAKAMSKHGDDYNKMFYDLKANPMQHTRDKLTKLGARYLLLSPHQRRTEIPENVQRLISA
jgi:hypothetical protein